MAKRIADFCEKSCLEKQQKLSFKFINSFKSLILSTEFQSTLISILNNVSDTFITFSVVTAKVTVSDSNT